MGTKIENATPILAAAVTGIEYIALGKVGWVTSKCISLDELSSWMAAEPDKIYEGTSYIEVYDAGAATGELRFHVEGATYFLVTAADGIQPVLDGTLDLGDSTHEFKDIYIDGKGYIDSLELGLSTTTVTDITTTVDAGSLDTELPTAKACFTAIGASSAARWFAFAAFLRTASSTFTSTTLVVIGTPVKWTEGASTHYGIITTVAAGAPNTYTITGYPMGATATAGNYGNSELVYTERIHIDGAFATSTIAASATTGLLYQYMNMKTQYIWRKANARIVSMDVICFTDDSTVDPAIYLYNNQAGVYNSVFSVSVTATSTIANTGVAMAGTAYELDRDDILELAVTVTGTGDAKDLDVIVTMIMT